MTFVQTKLFGNGLKVTVESFVNCANFRVLVACYAVLFRIARQMTCHLIVHSMYDISHHH